MINVMKGQISETRYYLDRLLHKPRSIIQAEADALTVAIAILTEILAEHEIQDKHESSITLNVKEGI